LPAVAASVADYDRSHAGTVAVAIPKTVPVAIAVTVAVPEYAPVTIAITIVIVIAVEAARLAKAVIAKPAAYALDLLDDAQLGLRRRNIGGAGEIDGVGAVGQQRRAGDGCGGGQRHQQELAHFSSSSLFAVVTWKSRFSKPENAPIERPRFLPKEGPNRRHVTLAANEQELKEQTRHPATLSSASTGDRDAASLKGFGVSWK
jgi:hypothetical protein